MAQPANIQSAISLSTKPDKRLTITYMLSDLSMSHEAGSAEPQDRRLDECRNGVASDSPATPLDCPSLCDIRHAPTCRHEQENATRRSRLSPELRVPRPPRPVYSEEQKFFLMYARIVQNRAWPDIEDAFARHFGMRTKGGLTSVYYRVRRTWGLEEVLKGGTESYVQDKKFVDVKAQNFSKAFLIKIGYLR